MGLLKAVISIALCIWIYKYITNEPEKVKKIPYIGDFVANSNPLLIVIICLILLNIIL